MKEKKSKLPDFKKMTYKEEAHFWDTHSVTDFEDETEEVEIIFDLNKLKEETLVLRLQKNLKDKLTKVAKDKGINTSSLIRMWLTEKMHSLR